MPRAYTPSLVALALGVHPKWLDNVLSHHAVPGVAGGRQGRTRAISPPAVLTLAVALLLIRDLGIPIARALEAAGALVAARRDGTAELGPSEVALGSEVRLRVDLPAVERRLAGRLVEASEGWGPRRRGRPPADSVDSAASTDAGGRGRPAIRRRHPARPAPERTRPERQRDIGRSVEQPGEVAAGPGPGAGEAPRSGPPAA